MKNHLLSALILFFITTSLCRAQNTTLWGMTSFGGAHNGSGNIFKSTTAGSVTDIHDFGTGTDGNYPLGSVVQASNGLLYGMTENGGTIGSDGMIFSYDISTNTYTDIHDFGSGNDGYWPLGSIIQANNGFLYGMTQVGGANGGGIIFSYDILTSTYTDIHDFGSSASPQGSLMQASSGLLYGMTQYGGTGNGVIYSYDISTSTYTELYDFKGGANDGAYPQYGSLLQVNDSLLYGMTSNGGANAGAHGGVMFSFNILTNKDTVLHTFGNGTDGNYPEGSLIQASSGLIYGLATYGGSSNYYGTIFSYDISNGTYSSLHNFGFGTDGGSPYGSFLQVNDSLLYGMTRGGGTTGQGTIFTYNILADTEIDIHNFSGADGQYPYGNLIEASPLVVFPLTSKICSGDSIALIASGAATYSWAPAAGLSATTGDSVIASPTATTTYTVTGNSYTKTVVVIVGQGVAITVNIPLPVCNGSSTKLIAKGATTYTWTPSTGLNSTTGDSVIANPTVTTVYYVTGTSVGSCPSTLPDTVKVNVPQILDINPPSPVQECIGQPVTLSVPVSGSDYTWSPTTGLSATTGDTVTANPTANITYTVTGLDSLGCSVSGTEIVDIQTGPNKPIITVSVTGDTLFSSAKNGNQWYVNGKPIKNATDSIYVITGLPKDTFRVEVTNVANGCSTTSDSLVVSAGIEQLSLNSNQLSIYPNPFNNDIVVTISSSASDVKDWNLQLTDVLGRRLYIRQSLSYTNEIDLSNLYNGMYFISIYNKSSHATYPIVKQH